MAKLDAYMILESKGLANISDGPIPGETNDKEMLDRGAIEISSFSLSGQFDDGSLDVEKTSKLKATLKATTRLNDKLGLTVVKNLDNSSPALMVAYCSHLSTDLKEAKPFPSLKIILRKSGDIVGAKAQSQFLRLSFEHAYLISYSCSGEHESNKDMPTERLQFRFKEVGMDYWPQNVQGKLSSSIAPKTTMKWNFF